MKGCDIFVDIIGSIEAAKMLGVSKQAVSNFCHDNKLVCKRISGVWVIDKKSVERFLKEREGELNDKNIGS